VTPQRCRPHQSGTGALAGGDGRSTEAGGGRVGANPLTRLRIRYNRAVAMFLVVLRRSGPKWDPSQPMEAQSDWPAHAVFMDQLVDDGFLVLGGPLADEVRVAHAVEAESEDAIRSTLARDPWSETHLVVDSIDPWTIRLDSRTATAS
jgi:uncharacterized protein YciI